MSPRYQLTTEVQTNIDGICTFIAEESMDASLRVFAGLEHAFEDLPKWPESALATLFGVP